MGEYSKKHNSCLAEVPADVLLEIGFALHNAEDLISLSKACKKFWTIINGSPSIWKFCYEKRFGKINTQISPDFERWSSLLSLRLSLGTPFYKGLLYGLLQFCVEYKNHKTKFDHSFIQMRECAGFIDLETSDNQLFERFKLHKRGKLKLKLFTSYDQDQLEPITTFCVEEFSWDEGALVSSLSILEYEPSAD